MIGYIKPKKLKEIERFFLADECPGYVFEYYDEKTEEYRRMPYSAAVSEEDAQVGILECQWNDVIAEDLKELNKMRDELIAKKAVIRARLDRIIEQLDSRPDPNEYPDDFGGLTDEEFFELQEYEEELGDKIKALDEKEKRALKLIEENKWNVKNRHIRFSEKRVKTEIKNGEEFFYIDFTEETDGIVGRVKARTLDELKQKVSLENDRFRIEQGVIPEGGDFWLSAIVERQIAALSAAETRYLLRLFNLAVFSGAIDRKAARKKIYDLLGVSGFLEKSNKEELSREGIALRYAGDGAGDSWDKYTFSKYIGGYIKEKGISITELAGRIGCNRSSLSGNINGSHKPSRDRAVKLAVAMELSIDDMRIFLSSAGYTFPGTDIDYTIIKHLGEGGHKWYEILALLGVGK